MGCFNLNHYVLMLMLFLVKQMLCAQNDASASPDLLRALPLDDSMTAQIDVSPPALPTGYVYPQFPPVADTPTEAEQVQPWCSGLQTQITTVDVDLGKPELWPPYGLTPLSKEMVVHEINLDKWGPEWSGNLLTLLAGSKQVWNPAQNYKLLPSGIRGEADEVTLFLHRALRRFKLVKGDDGKVAIKAIDHTDTTISRLGDKVVVRYADLEIHFQSFDLGASFIPVWYGNRHIPAKHVTLEYNEEKVSAIVYPDGMSRTTFTWDADVVTRITFPDQDYISISRDPSGYISDLRFERPGKGKRKSNTTRQLSPGERAYNKLFGKEQEKKDNTPPALTLYHYQYEYDAQGRIVTFTDLWRNRAVTISYAESEEKDAHVYTTVLTDVASGDFYAQNLRLIGGGYDTAWHFGTKGQLLQDAQLLYQSEVHVVGDQYWRTNSWRRGEAFSALDKETLLASIKDLQTPPEQNPTSADVPKHLPLPGENATTEGSPKTWLQVFNQAGHIIYRGNDKFGYTSFNYSPEGLLVSCNKNGGYQFQYDDLGRMVEMTDFWHAKTIWSYDPHNQLQSITHFPAQHPDIRKRRGQSGHPDTPLVTSCTYDDWGRPLALLWPDGSTSNYKYTGHQLRLFTNRQNQRWKYRYNDRDQCVEKLAANGHCERWRYDRTGRLLASAERNDPAEEWQITDHSELALSQTNRNQ